MRRIFATRFRAEAVDQEIRHTDCLFISPHDDRCWGKERQIQSFAVVLRDRKAQTDPQTVGFSRVAERSGATSAATRC